MTELARMVDQYLQIKRAQGAQAVEVGRYLEKFCEHVEATRAGVLTVQVAVGFATAQPGLSDLSVSLRLSAVRGFCQWAHALDPTIEVPPHGLLKIRQTRSVPYIYSPAEITELLDSAALLHPSLRAATITTLIGLMAATGIRTGEARALSLGDFNPPAATLKITGKYGKIRLLPLHTSVAEALTRYISLRSQNAAAAACPALLVSSLGTRLAAKTVSYNFRKVLEGTSLLERSRTCRPRPMDLRHTFAVKTMLDAYRSGQDPMQVLPVLSTWMGHVNVAQTYWYLSCTPALMQAAAQRLERKEP